MTLWLLFYGKLSVCKEKLGSADRLRVYRKSKHFHGDAFFTAIRTSILSLLLYGCPFGLLVPSDLVSRRFELDKNGNKWNRTF